MYFLVYLWKTTQVLLYEIKLISNTLYIHFLIHHNIIYICYIITSFNYITLWNFQQSPWEKNIGATFNYVFYIYRPYIQELVNCISHCIVVNQLLHEGLQIWYLQSIYFIFTCKRVSCITGYENFCLAWSRKLITL